MASRVEIEDRTGRAAPVAKRLRPVLAAALRRLGIRRGEVSLLLVNNPFIRRLNREYRGVDRPTDVLSFPQEEPSGRRRVRPAGPHLGDIVISLPAARVQARERGHSLEREVTLLAVHGLLHLLGHDHATPRERREMFRLQAALLGGAGHV